MICPKCGEISNGGKWCARCGARLEIDDVAHISNLNSECGTSDDYQTPEPQSPDNSYQYSTEQGYPSRNSYDGYESENSSAKKLKIVLAVLCPIMAVLVILAFLAAFGVINFGSSKEAEIPSDAQQTSQESSIELLRRQAMNHIKIGDYIEAEKALKSLLELDPYNDEIAVLCKIVFNYNQALEAVKNKNIADARNYFDKIPAEYMDYDISADVDKLEGQIEDYESAYTTFSDIKNYMENGKYDEAEMAIGILDESRLSDSDAALLNGYIDTIEKEKAEKENKKNDDRDESDFGSQQSASITESYASSLINSYCAAYVSAVNAGDFSIVAPYLAGDMYATQKKMVESCAKDGITMDFDYFSLNSLQKSADNKWKAKVSEGETIYYADGSAKSKSYTWTYTIEYMNSRYYLTKIE